MKYRGGIFLFEDFVGNIFEEIIIQSFTDSNQNIRINAFPFEDVIYIGSFAVNSLGKLYD